MSNQINQREEDKKRLFGKTPDTQPEQIQEQEAGAAAADPEEDSLTLDETLDFFKEPENTKSIIDEMKKLARENGSDYDLYLDFANIAEELVTQYKTRENVLPVLTYITLMGVYYSLAKPSKGEKFSIKTKAPSEEELKSKIKIMIGEEKFNQLIKVQEKYTLSDPPTVTEVLSVILGTYLFSSTLKTDIVPTISKPRKVEKFEFPLDKLNSSHGKFWGLLEEDTNGQLKLDMSSDNTAGELNLIYSVDFSALEGLHVRKELNDYDKRVYFAISSLYNAGYTIITATQIYYAMGYTKRPNSRELDKILKSVTKMIALPITIDNSAEAAVYNYPKFTYFSTLLPAEGGIIVNVSGTKTENAIHLFREPPVMTFGKQRNQITTLPIKLLQTPVNKTDQAIAHEDYFIARISEAKHRKKKSLTLLIKTIQEKANLNEKNARTKERSERFLNHYKENGWIKSYTITNDKIIIILDKE